MASRCSHNCFTYFLATKLHKTLKYFNFFLNFFPKINTDKKNYADCFISTRQKNDNWKVSERLFSVAIVHCFGLWWSDWKNQGLKIPRKQEKVYSMDRTNHHTKENRTKTNDAGAYWKESFVHWTAVLQFFVCCCFRELVSKLCIQCI